MTDELPAGTNDNHPRETAMSDDNQKEIVRIELTTEQKEQVKAATHKDVQSIELSVQELEARITPLAILAD
jgi:hypothetical protein